MTARTAGHAHDISGGLLQLPITGTLGQPVGGRAWRRMIHLDRESSPPTFGATP